MSKYKTAIEKMLSCYYFEDHDSGAYCKKDKMKPINKYGQKCINCTHFKERK